MVYICNQVSPLIRLWAERMLEDRKRDCRPECHLWKPEQGMGQGRNWVCLPPSANLRLALLAFGWGSESERPKAAPVPAAAPQDGSPRAGRWGAPASEAVRSSVHGWLGGPRTAKRLPGGRGRPWRASIGLHAQCGAPRWACIGMRRLVPPSSHRWFMWEIYTQRPHLGEQDIREYC